MRATPGGLKPKTPIRLQADGGLVVVTVWNLPDYFSRVIFLVSLKLFAEMR